MVFAVALALRAAFALFAAGSQDGLPAGARELDTVAWNLTSGEGFVLGEPGNPVPTASIPPLVPWVTSLLYRTFGHRYFAAILMQCVAAALVPLLIGQLGAATFGESAGRLAAWLCAFDPLLISFAAGLSTETLFSVVLLLALCLSAAWVKTPRPGRAFGVGLGWGAAALTQASALLLPAVVLLWAWAPLGLTVRPRDRVRQVALALLGLALVVGPWTARNAAVLHRFVPVAAAGATAPDAGAGSGPREWPTVGAARLSRMWGPRAPAEWASPWRADGAAGPPPARAAVPLAAWSLGTLALALWGLSRVLASPRRWFQSLAALAILYLTLLAVATDGALGERVPVQPLVALYAAVGFEDAYRRARLRARGFKLVEGRR